MHTVDEAKGVGREEGVGPPEIEAMGQNCDERSTSSPQYEPQGGQVISI